MSGHEDDARPGAPDGARTRRRKQVAAAAVGLTALLGAGAYMITAQVVGGDHKTVTRDAGAQGSLTVPGRGEASVPAQDPSPSPSRGLTVEQRIKAAREAAANDGYKVQRGLTPAPGVKEATDVVERQEAVPNGALRIITARSDLTGQRELLWPADKGTRHGAMTCTQNVKFANNQAGAVRKNLLLCWRVSAKKSVATVLVDYGGHPSVARSAEIIGREWAKLG